MAVLCFYFVIAGCGRDASRRNTSTSAIDSTYAAPRRPGVDPSFLDAQIKRGEVVQQQLETYRHAQPPDREQIRALLVKRKGEILSAKKMVRESMNLTDSQKEVMLSKLDEESIDLAQELVAVSQ